LHFADLETKTEFIKLLEEGHELGDYSKAFEHLKNSSTSSVDFEMQMLSLQNDFKQLRLVIKMLEHQMDSNKDFELVQAYTFTFLKHHGEIISKNPELFPLLDSLKGKQRETWTRLQTMFHNSLCLVKFFSGIQT